MMILIVIFIIILFFVLGSDERSKLPFRQIAECFLLTKKKGKWFVIAKKNKKYISFPGGGVEKGQTIKEAAEREIEEEIGAVNVDLKKINTAKFVWWPEWTEGIEKREKRYKIFQGEEITMFFGVVEKFIPPTSTEGDAWEGNISKYFCDIKSLIKIHKKLGQKEKTNATKNYRKAQNESLNYCLEYAAKN